MVHISIKMSNLNPRHLQICAFWHAYGIKNMLNNSNPIKSVETQSFGRKREKKIGLINLNVRIQIGREIGSHLQMLIPKWGKRDVEPKVEM